MGIDNRALWSFLVLLITWALPGAGVRLSGHSNQEQDTWEGTRARKEHRLHSVFPLLMAPGEKARPPLGLMQRSGAQALGSCRQSGSHGTRI